MVPSNNNGGFSKEEKQLPCFPNCVDWIKENQKVDGSWGLNPNHPSLVQDSLSSTLACVLALQKWNAGEQLVQKGLEFIGSNRSAVDDKNQISPLGFDIVFPGLISYAQDLGLNLPLDTAFLDQMHYNRDTQIQREKAGSLAYFAEGIGESYDWKELIKNEQRSNGSIFNSPATTAAALIHIHDDKCFEYLQSVLKINGKADSLEEYVDQEHFFNTSSPQITTANTIIELYKASEVKILEDEPILENIQNWTNTFLKHQLSNQEICDDQLRKEADYALGYSINTANRIAHRRRIELYNANHFRMLKTSYRWAKNSRMVSLNFDWHILVTCYFQIAAVHFLPEEADMRALWTHIGVIGTFLDDMFDDDGSREELLNFVELVEKWDDHSAVGYSSERVEILFSEAQKSVDYFASKGFIVQGRCIRHELIEWVDYIKSQMKEVEWWRKKETPSMDEYIINGGATIGVGLWVIGLYFLGAEFSKDTISTPEFQSLYKHGSLLPRLLNDCHGIKERDKVQRKINGCWLLMKHKNGAITEEEAVKEVTRMSENSNREVLRTSLLRREESVIPWVIRDAFFKMLQIGHYLYGSTTDEYRRPIKNFDDIKAVLYEPIILNTFSVYLSRTNGALRFLIHCTFYSIVDFKNVTTWSHLNTILSALGSVLDRPQPQDIYPHGFVSGRSRPASQGVTHPGIALVQARLTSEFSWDPKPVSYPGGLVLN
ncbi:hypothetical protein LguiB_013577 [Lonicera macranthoides]